MKVRTFILVLGMAFGLAGCNSGLDHKLDTSHGVEAYKSSLAEATKDMKKSEIEAFDLYVEELSIEKLSELYPDATPRKVIRGQAKKVIEGTAKIKPELEKMIPDFDKEFAALEGGIKAVNAKFSVEKDFFGDQPKVRATVQNTSGQGLTALKWQVDLYINGADKPVASSVVEDNYKGGGGIKDGYEYKRDFTLGFVRGDDRFTTLEIQNAKQREVRLTLLVNDCTDLTGKRISSRNPHSLLKVFGEAEMRALKDKDI